jgi:benzoylformate decarboxylase
MAFLSGKQAFLEVLKQEGVELVFGNPGTTELPLMDGLAREPKIRISSSPHRAFGNPPP